MCDKEHLKGLHDYMRQGVPEGASELSRLDLAANGSSDFTEGFSRLDSDGIFGVFISGSRGEPKQ